MSVCSFFFYEGTFKCMWKGLCAHMSHVCFSCMCIGLNECLCVCGSKVDTHSTPQEWTKPAVTAPSRWVEGCEPGTPHVPVCSFFQYPSPPSAAQCPSSVA